MRLVMMSRQLLAFLLPLSSRQTQRPFLRDPSLLVSTNNSLHPLLVNLSML